VAIRLAGVSLLTTALLTPFVVRASEASSGSTAASAVASARNDATLLPGGLRTIVRDHVPGGPRFAIVGERYQLSGRTGVTLQIDIEHSGAGEPARGRRQRLFSWYFWTSCKPHEYAVLYGLLRVARDTAWARMSSGMKPLRRASIPESLHAGGVLVYAVLPRLPSELVIRTPSGRVALTESLRSLQRVSIEVCEGQP
jgi:hypothetical protein